MSSFVWRVLSGIRIFGEEISDLDSRQPVDFLRFKVLLCAVFCTRGFGFLPGFQG